MSYITNRMRHRMLWATHRVFLSSDLMLYRILFRILHFYWFDQGILNSKLHLISGSHYPASASTTMLFNNWPSPSPGPAMPMYFFKSLSRWAANWGSMLKIVACMLCHYAVAAAVGLCCCSRHCCTVLQPLVMRCTASNAAALCCGSSRCKALMHGDQLQQAWDRWTAEVWSVHMLWWRCIWCAGMLIAVMKTWYSSCPEFKRPSGITAERRQPFRHRTPEYRLLSQACRAKTWGSQEFRLCS
jgi:hypothetical protein